MHPADAAGGAPRASRPRPRPARARRSSTAAGCTSIPTPRRGHNERLEFLGDAVVEPRRLRGAVPAPSRPTTRASCPRAARRSSSTPGLARLATRIDLGPYLLLGEGEAQRGGRVRPSLLASAFEALVGAIYLDLGWEAARDWIHELAAEELSADLAITTLKSPKSRLQEHTQRTHRASGRCTGSSRPSGPDHEKQFRIEVVVDGRTLGVGEGPSRRIAETSAAAQALDVLRSERARAAKAASPRGGPADGRRGGAGRGR